MSGFGAAHITSADDNSEDARRLRSLAFMGEDESDAEMEDKMTSEEKFSNDIREILSFFENFDAAAVTVPLISQLAESYETLLTNMVDRPALAANALSEDDFSRITACCDLLKEILERTATNKDGAVKRKTRDLAALIEETREELDEAVEKAQGLVYAEDNEDNEEAVMVSDSDFEQIDFDELESVIGVPLVERVVAVDDRVFIESDEAVEKALVGIAIRRNDVTAVRTPDVRTVRTLVAAAADLATKCTTCPTLQLRALMEATAVAERLPCTTVDEVRTHLGLACAMVRLAKSLGRETVAEVHDEHTRAIEASTNGVRKITVAILYEDAVIHAATALEQLTGTPGTALETRETVAAIELQAVVDALAAARDTVIAQVSTVARTTSVTEACIRVQILYGKSAAQHAADVARATRLAAAVEAPFTPPMDEEPTTTLNGKPRMIAIPPPAPATALWVDFGLNENVEEGREIVDVVEELTHQIYEQRENMNTNWQLYYLYFVYCLALNGQYSRARRLLLGSRIQEEATGDDFALTFAVNRAVLMVGVAAFAAGDFTGAAELLSEVSVHSRIRELIGQHGGRRRAVDDDDETAAAAAQQAALLPLHRHIAPDVVEAAAFLAAAVSELPTFAAAADRDHWAVRSKAARALHKHAEHVAIHSCPVTLADFSATVAAAAFAGDWAGCEAVRGKVGELVSQLPVAHDDGLADLVMDRLRDLALVSYLTLASTLYANVSLAEIASIFFNGSTEGVVRAVVRALGRGVHGRLSADCAEVVFAEACEEELSAFLN